VVVVAGGPLQQCDQARVEQWLRIQQLGNPAQALCGQCRALRVSHDHADRAAAAHGDADTRADWQSGGRRAVRREVVQHGAQRAIHGHLEDPRLAGARQAHVDKSVDEGSVPASTLGATRRYAPPVAWVSTEKKFSEFMML